MPPLPLPYAKCFAQDLHAQVVLHSYVGGAVHKRSNNPLYQSFNSLIAAACFETLQNSMSSPQAARRVLAARLTQNSIPLPSAARRRRRLLAARLTQNSILFTLLLSRSALAGCEADVTLFSSIFCPMMLVRECVRCEMQAGAAEAREAELGARGRGGGGVPDRHAAETHDEARLREGRPGEPPGGGAGAPRPAQPEQTLAAAHVDTYSVFAPGLHLMTSSGDRVNADMAKPWPSVK